jgi:hypothetical protein
VREYPFNELFHDGIPGVGDIDRHEVGIAIRIQIISPNGHILTARDAQKRDILRGCRICEVNDVNAFIHLVQICEIAADEKFTGGGDVFGRDTPGTGLNLGTCFIDRLEITVVMLHLILQAAGQKEDRQDEGQ